MGNSQLDDKKKRFLISNTEPNPNTKFCHPVIYRPDDRTPSIRHISRSADQYHDTTQKIRTKIFISPYNGTNIYNNTTKKLN